LEPCKVFVDVMAAFDREGRLTPLSLVWEDGRKYPVDQVLDVRRAASLKAGGIGTRYTVRIYGKRTYLFFDGKQWFVERRLSEGG